MVRTHEMRKIQKIIVAVARFEFYPNGFGWLVGDVVGAFTNGLQNNRKRQNDKTDV